jgi:hypothetical protein
MDSGKQEGRSKATPPSRLRAALLLLPTAALACSIGASVTQPDAESTSVVRSLELQWPIEVGASSFVTQSPAESGQPYPCGSGVNGRHILHDEHGLNHDYLESLDIIAGSPQASESGDEGRGTDVVAVADGRVVALNFSQNECDRPFGAGNYVVIEHSQMQLKGKPLRSAYMHLNSMQQVEDESCGLNPSPSNLNDFRPPALGSLVRAGQKLGEVGNTGNSTGPHLHFQFATECTLEPASAVDCPSIALLDVNAQGFDNIETSRDEECAALPATGGPGPSTQVPNTYLADGTHVTSLGPESETILAATSP